MPSEVSERMPISWIQIPKKWSTYVHYISILYSHTRTYVTCVYIYIYIYNYIYIYIIEREREEKEKNILLLSPFTKRHPSWLALDQELRPPPSLVRRRYSWDWACTRCEDLENLPAPTGLQLPHSWHWSFQIYKTRLAHPRPPKLVFKLESRFYPYGWHSWHFRLQQQGIPAWRCWPEILGRLAPGVQNHGGFAAYHQIYHQKNTSVSTSRFSDDSSIIRCVDHQPSDGLFMINDVDKWNPSYLSTIYPLVI